MTGVTPAARGAQFPHCSGRHGGLEDPNVSRALRSQALWLTLAYLTLLLLMARGQV
ncbi:MAG TPA: hypothetical protein VHQ66_15455 [Myxococcota bacterium]|nr:hypothetical protein [Myxococcota bacterium]